MPARTLSLVFGSLAFCFGAAIFVGRARYQGLENVLEVHPLAFDGDASVSTEHSRVNCKSPHEENQLVSERYVGPGHPVTTPSAKTLFSSLYSFQRGIVERTRLPFGKKIHCKDVDSTDEVSEIDLSEVAEPTLHRSDGHNEHSQGQTPNQVTSNEMKEMNMPATAQESAIKHNSDTVGYFVDEATLEKAVSFVPNGLIGIDRASRCARSDAQSEVQQRDIEANQSLLVPSKDVIVGSPKRSGPFSRDSTHMAPSREEQQENEALEEESIAVSFEQKPWRRYQERPAYTSVEPEGRPLSRRDFRRMSESQADSKFVPTFSDTNVIMEDDESLSFLSPDILQQFHDVDRTLAHEFEHYNEQDKIVTSEFNRFESSMDPTDSDDKGKPDDESRSLSDNDNTNSALVLPAATAYTVETSIEKLPWKYDNGKRFRPINQNGSSSEESLLSEDEDARYEFHRLRNQFERNAVSSLSEEHRTGTNFCEHPISCLLPPQNMDEDENPDVSFSDPEPALEPSPNEKRRPRKSKVRRQRRKK